MKQHKAHPEAGLRHDLTLQIYLLGTVDFEAMLALQKRLVYEISGQGGQAALVVCEHKPLITVGRQGSRGHILCEAEELRARQWQVCWVNRGGGCLLHLPGQVAIYPLLPLDRLGLNLGSYLRLLRQVLGDVLADFSLEVADREDGAALWVGPRPVAALGVAIRDWVSYFGAALNVNVPLAPFRLVRWGGLQAEPMTSLERERHGPVRPSLVRQRLLEHFGTRFGFVRQVFFSDHVSLHQPALPQKARLLGYQPNSVPGRL